MAVADYGTVSDPGTISAILKDFYIGPLQEQLNQEVMCLEMFEKAKVSWAGRQAIVPLHVSRNAGVAYGAESSTGTPGNLPTAGTQGVARLSIEASYLYGRMQVTGQAVAAAKQGGSASFIGTLDLEMEKLKDDIRNRANEACVTGGRVIGLTNRHTEIAHQSTGNVINVDGNLEKVAALFTANNALSVDFIVAGVEDLGVTSAYKFVHADGFHNGTSGSNFATITAINPAAGTITVTGNGKLSFDLIPANVACAVRLRGQSDTSTITAAGVYDPDREPVGILGNLYSTQHFGVERQTGATGCEKSLQTFALGMDNDDARENVDLENMQLVVDTISSRSGLDPDLILCNSAMRSQYIRLLNGNVQLDPKTAATVVDGGVTGINFNGIPIRSSRHVPPGMFIFLNTSTFKLAILEDGKFADMDGNVLSRVSGADAFEGFYKWYYNHYCYRPNASGVLTGLLGGTLTA